MNGAEQGRTASDQDVLRIEQQVHGYDDGHRLLISSPIQLGSDDARVIDRLSDAAGRRPIESNDGYLTGYPLPSGQWYALARTWYVHDAPRPNTVVTHTLLIPPPVLSRRAASSLVGLLQNPLSTSISALSARLHVPEDAEATVWVGDTVLAARTLSSLYVSPLRGSLVLDIPELREQLCLAIWDQQWPRLRATFAFCSGAVDERRLTKRPFDLNIYPPRPGDQNDYSEMLRPSPAVDALVRDLQVPSALRDFLVLVGGDSARLRVMQLFIDTYLGLNSGKEVDLVESAGRLALAAPRPTSMRRLKRATFRRSDSVRSGDRTAPLSMLHALTAEPVSSSVLVADSSLADWVSDAWEVSPLEVLTLVAGHLRGDGDDLAELLLAGPPAQPTVTEGYAFAVVQVISKRAKASQLPLITTQSPVFGAALVRSKVQDAAWFTSWANLPDELYDSTIAAGILNDADDDVVRACVLALVEARDGAERFSPLLERMEERAAIELLDQRAAAIQDSDSWLAVLRENPELIFRALPSVRDPAGLAVAADVAPNPDFVRSISFEVWTPLALDAPRWSTSDRRLAVMYLASQTSRGRLADMVFAQAYAGLYARFETGSAPEAWRLLERTLPSKHDDWDQCARLARQASRDLRKTDRMSVLDFLPAGSARHALDEHLRPKKPADAPEPPQSRPPNRSKKNSNPLDAIVSFLKRPW